MRERLYLKPEWARGSVAREERPQVNRSLVIGLVGSVLLVVFGAVIGGRPLTFLSLEGMLLVLGGTACSTLVQFSARDLRSAMKAARGALFQRQESPVDRIQALVRLSRRVKESGVLVLEDEASATTDSFLRLGLQLTVDGQNPEEISRILQTEMRSANEQAWRSVQVFETMGNFAPAMGLIGTLIGLIQMLGSLQDAATIGPAMSLALVATLYGSVAANLFFFPIAGKLRVIAQEREQTKDITAEGLLSIARLESPIMLEQRLQSFISCASNQ
jgi:chemotaxis protein MotA